MEAVLIIAVLAWAGYKFVKFNTAAGAEAVRAFVYLEGLKRGENKDRANEVVDIDLVSINPDQLRRVTETIQTVHGKQLPLMGEAYRRGMRPKVPTWYYNFVLKTPASPSVRREYSAQPVKTAPANETPERNFAEYNRAFIEELKKLSGKLNEEIHYIELMDDEPTRRAFSDDIDPIELAASAWCQFASYEEYYASVRNRVVPHFADIEAVEQLLRIKDELIRAGHSSGVHPKLISEKYRAVLNVVFKQGVVT